MGEQLGRGERGDERTGERQPGYDMKNELFSVLFFALFGVPLLSKKQKVLSSKTVSSVSACNTKTKVGLVVMKVETFLYTSLIIISHILPVA